VFRQGAKLYNKTKKELLLNEDQDYIFDEVETKDVDALPEQSAEVKATTDVVMGMIDELPELQRSAVVSFYYDHLKIEEIAKVFDCSVNTIKSRLNYAKKFLKSKVEEHQKQYSYKLFSFSPAVLLLALRGLLASEKYTMAPESAEKVYHVACDALGITASAVTAGAVGVAASSAAGAGATAAAGTVASTGATGAVAGTAATAGTAALEGAAIGATATASAAGTATTVATAAKAGGLIGKFLAMSTAAKTGAVVLATAVIGGGATTAVLLSNNNPEPPAIVQEVVIDEPEITLTPEPTVTIAPKTTPETTTPAPTATLDPIATIVPTATAIPKPTVTPAVHEIILAEDLQISFHVYTCGKNGEEVFELVRTIREERPGLPAFEIYNLLSDENKYSEQDILYGIYTHDWKEYCLDLAKSYIETGFYSENGLIRHLNKYYPFVEEDITYAVKNCGADWDQEAPEYLEYFLFYEPALGQSYKLCVEEMKWALFTNEQIEYALGVINPDWHEQAVKKATSMIEFSTNGYSYSALVDQLVELYFDYDIAQEAVDSIKKDIDWNAEAVKSANTFAKLCDSKQEFFEILEGRGFTYDQIEYAAKEFGW